MGKAFLTGTGGWSTLAVAVLCAATYLSVHPGLRYSAAPAEVFAERTVALDPGAWQRTPSGVEFVMADGVATARLAGAGDGGASALATDLVVPEGIDAVRVTLALAAEAMTPGEESWQTGRVQILSYDRRGRLLWYWPKDIAVLSGNLPWRAFGATIPIGPEIRQANLLVYNGARSGLMTARSIRVAGLRERPVLTVMRYALAMTWGLFGLWIAGALIRRGRRAAGSYLLLGAAVLALAGTLTPQPGFQSVSAPLEAWAQSWLATIARTSAPAPVEVTVSVPAEAQGEARRGPSMQRPAATSKGPSGRDAGANPARAEAAGSTPAPEPGRAGGASTAPAPTSRSEPAPARAPVAQGPDYPFSFKQLGHFAVFILLGLAAYMAFPRVPAVHRFAYLLLFAIATESLQLFVVTRSAKLSDLLVDAAGLLFSAGLLLAARWATAGARAWLQRRAGPAAWP